MLDNICHFGFKFLFLFIRNIYMLTINTYMLIYFAILNFYLTKLLTHSNEVKNMILPEDILISNVI